MKPFKPNDFPTLGVEEEFQIIDQHSWRLSVDKTIHDVKALLSPDMQKRVCDEVFNSIIENRSGVCRTVDSLMEQVRAGRKAIQKACEQLDLSILAAGAYPRSDWRCQQFVDTPHYQWLKQNYFYLAKRLMAFGLHVHVGVKSEAAAFYVMHEMKRWAYPLLALSANSPFYDEFDTGLNSCRTHLFHSLPRTGFAPDFQSHDQLEQYYNKMVAAGDISRPGDLWWVIRPPLPLGTVEYRMCDLPTDVQIVGILVAILQAATAYYQDAFYRGEKLSAFKEEYFEQNCWRCTKDGLEAVVIDPVTEDAVDVRELLQQLLDMIWDKGKELHCEQYLESARCIIVERNEATLQRELFKKSKVDYDTFIQTLCNKTLDF